MKKLIPYVLVFVLGFGACAWILRELGYTTISPGGKQGVIANLSRDPGQAILSKKGNVIADAVARLGPAVVNIDTVSEQAVSSPFEQLFGIPMSPMKQQVVGQGSGVIISKDGYVLTNNHVVEGANKIVVRLSDGRRLSGKLVGRDARTDLAVLKVDGKDLPAADFGDSNAIRAGDWAIAVGNPLGFGNSVTVGVISATKRTDLPVGPGKVLAEAIQTDAAINRGNSGGALANIDGQLIGINTAIFSTEPGQGNIGIGFAIPSNTARTVATQLIEKGRIIRPWIGVQLAELSGDFAAWYEQRGLKPPKGVVVAQTVADGPAAKKGLLQGDIIVQMDDKKVPKPDDLIDEVGKHKVGDVIRLSIWRMGRTQVIMIKLEEMPAGAG